jgi:hypothetical protein
VRVDNIPRQARAQHPPRRHRGGARHLGRCAARAVYVRRLCRASFMHSARIAFGSLRSDARGQKQNCTAGLTLKQGGR